MKRIRFPEGFLIGIAGSRGVGKTTIGDLLRDRYGFAHVSFADKLYKESAQAFGVTVESLAERSTKETPQPHLILKNCTDPDFVDICRSLFNLSLNTPISPRQILNWWGTEYRRNHCGECYWLDHGMEAAYGSGKPVWISDMRLRNEHERIVGNGHHTGRVINTEVDQREALLRASGDVAANHVSAIDLLDVTMHTHMENPMNGDIGFLEKRVIEAIEWLR